MAVKAFAVGIRRASPTVARKAIAPLFMMLYGKGKGICVRFGLSVNKDCPDENVSCVVVTAYSEDMWV
jgi:hypothetical protein